MKITAQIVFEDEDEDGEDKEGIIADFRNEITSALIAQDESHVMTSSAWRGMKYWVEVSIE